MIGLPAPSVSRRWQRVPAYALLSALGVAAGEIASLSGDRIGGKDLLEFLPTAWVQWSAALLLVAAYSEVAVPRWRTGTTLAIAAGVVAPIAAAVCHQVARWVNNPTEADLRAPFAYTLWVCIFYGLLFVIARVGIERVERTRRLLASAELARSRAESDASAAELDALRGQLDPGLMLRVMETVQRRYTQDPQQADRLLDAFVTFLRAAMPAVRSGASTLAAELALLRAHASLFAGLDLDRRLTIEVDGLLPEARFPPLALLPVVEALLRASEGAARVVVACDKTRTTLTLHARAEPGWLDDAARYRVQVALRAAGGDGWRLDVPRLVDEGDERLVLLYDAGAVAPERTLPAAPGPGASSPTGEPPWTTTDWTTSTAAT